YHSGVGKGRQDLTEGGNPQTSSPERELAVHPVVEAGVEGPQLLEGERGNGAAPIGRAVDRVVVETDQVTVGGELEVGFEMVRSRVETRAEGQHGVLRPQDAAASMGDDLAPTPGMGKLHAPILRADPRSL